MCVCVRYIQIHRNTYICVFLSYRRDKIVLFQYRAALARNHTKQMNRNPNFKDVTASPPFTFTFNVTFNATKRGLTAVYRQSCPQKDKDWDEIHFLLDPGSVLVSETKTFGPFGSVSCPR